MLQSPDVLLYRILGSDLPPRHHERQTLNNVKFILEHERLADGIERRWILNRIWNSGAEEELIRLLTHHNQFFDCIPFDHSFYRQQFLDASGLPPRFDPLKIINAGPQKHAEVLAFEWVYRHKNLAAIGINSARNAAIELGIKQAAWVLPFDGNTFMREDALLELRELIEQNPDAKYLIIPMVRFFNNSLVLDRSVKLDKTDEPQIGLRNDACDRFDERLRYGRMNKAELLVRLGVPGPWHERPAAPWESHDKRPAQDYGKFVVGSWVARLNPAANERVEATSSNRWAARLLSVANYCIHIDISLVDLERLTSTLHCYGDLSGQASNCERVINQADSALGLEFASVMDKSVVPPSRDKHDYLTPFPHTQRDGERRPEADDPVTSNRPHFQSFANLVVTLSLAFRMSADVRYAKQAAACVTAWFLDPASRMNPNAYFAQIREDAETPNFTGIVEFRDLWAILDALRIIKSAEAITQGQSELIAEWLRQFRDNWTSTEAGKQATAARNNIAVAHDLVVASISAYLGDRATTVWILDKAPLRMHRHIEPYGLQLYEVSRTRPLHYSLFNLQLWSNLARLSRSTGIVDLWRCGSADHRSLAWALRFLCLNRAYFQDYASDSHHFDQRIDLLLSTVPQDAADHEVLSDIPRTGERADLVNYRDGVPPLWYLQHCPARTDIGKPASKGRNVAAL